MKKTVLLTRPRAASARWAAQLESCGFSCAIDPVLAIEPTNAPCPAGDFQAVLITSANAPDILQKNQDPLAALWNLPCFCVGAATADAARRLGFTRIDTGAADGAALAEKAAESLPDKTRPLLHLCGETVNEQMRERLTQKGFSVTSWPIYRARAAQDFSPGTLRGLAAGDYRFLPVFSPRTARILITLIDKNNLTTACQAITAIAFSQAVADVLQTKPWRRLRLAAAPNEEEMLACLQSEDSVTEPAAPTPEKTPQPRRKKRRAAGILAIAALAGAAAIALDRHPAVQSLWPVAAPPAPPVSAPPPEWAALESRVAALESRLNAPTEPASPPTADASAQETQIKDMQARLDALQSHLQADQQTLQHTARAAGQKAAAETLAFLNLRDEADQGHPFAAQLAAMHTLAENDAALAPALSLLFSYAAEGAPTVTQLREDLLRREATLPPAEATDVANDWQSRMKERLSHLISIRPARDARLAPVEEALANGNAAQAIQSADVWPDDLKKSLASWRAKLEARATIDDALRQMSSGLTTATVEPAP